MSPRPRGPSPPSRCCAREKSRRARRIRCGGRTRLGRTCSTAFPGRAPSNSEAGGSRCRRAKWFGSPTRAPRAYRGRARPLDASLVSLRRAGPRRRAHPPVRRRGPASGGERQSRPRRVVRAAVPGVERPRDRSLDFISISWWASSSSRWLARSPPLPRETRRIPLSAVVAAVRADIRRSWSAAEIARLGGLETPSQTRRLFQKNLRESPRRWLIRERLIAAQSLIIRENAPIASIAEACGFCDVYHFGREFKRVVGASPAAWRRTELGARDMSKTSIRGTTDDRIRST